MNRLPVSICMISGAEAHRIGRALESVADWTSEIIVVLNDDVNDGTDRISESFGAHVLREPWKGFIAQKNSASAKATQPWLLNLDADEVVSPALRDEIVRVVIGTAVSHAAYEFPRCTLYSGRWIRHGDWYPDRVCRLWRQGRARWTGDEPHAELQVDGSIGRLRADLLHHSMESVDHQVLKIIHYADDFAQGCRTTGRRVRFLDVLVRPPWRFLRCFVFKLGFLDGWQGFSLAWMTAFYTFLRYFKALEAKSSSNRHPIEQGPR